MKALLRLYPGWWRQRYEGELLTVLEDLAHDRGPRRWRYALDLIRGAVDAHLSLEAPMSTSDRPALRRGLLIALLVWAALSVEIVLSNVVYPTTADDDGASVLAGYTLVVVALAATGAMAARRSETARGPILAGALAGAVIGALTIATFLVIDNAFLATIAQQQTKIDGLARSGMTSMRAYVNLSLGFGFIVLTLGLGVLGAGLGAAGGAVATRLRRGPSHR